MPATVVRSLAALLPLLVSLLALAARAAPVVVGGTDFASYAVLNAVPHGRVIGASLFVVNASADVPELNAFGRAFVAARMSWTSDLCRADSDGDGLTNGDELGDPCCWWQAGFTPRRLVNITMPGERASNSSLASCMAGGQASPNITFSLVSTTTVGVNWASSEDQVDLCVCYFDVALAPWNGLYQTVTWLDWRQQSYLKLNLREGSLYSFRLQAHNLAATMTPAYAAVNTSVDPLGPGVGENCSSNVTTWSALFGGAQQNDSLVIYGNQTVMMDMTPPTLGTLSIVGCLIFDDQDDYNITAYQISVSGLLQIGTMAARYQHRVVITLIGERTSRAGLGLGYKNLIARGGGVLSLHGQLRLPTWTQLDATAHAGERVLRLAAAANWTVGDRVFVASTDKNWRHAEERDVLEVLDGGRALNLSAPLAYTHYGELQRFGAALLDERAEVGRLTRNIVIRGDEASVADGFGGHTIFVESARAVRIDSVEFTRMGQRGILGRYPVHFHMAENKTESYVHRCAIHHNFQRCLTIHGTHRVTVTHNVAKDTSGHCYFLEDAIEMYNVIEDNLGLGSLPIAAANQILFPTNHDSEPATFWLTHPTNTVRRNAAAGGDGHGFWFQLESFPVGPSATPYVRPMRSHVVAFENNRAHSNAIHGINLWHDFFPCVDPSRACDANSNPWLRTPLVNVTSYHNRAQGHFGYVQGDVRVDGAIYADNPIGYTFNVAQPNFGVTLSNATFVGRSANGDAAPTSCGGARQSNLIGVQSARNGLLVVRNASFFNYNDTCLAYGMAVDVKNDEMGRITPYTFQLAGLAFHNASRMRNLFGTGHFPQAGTTTYFDSYAYALVKDLDGTLFGRGAGATGVPNNALMFDSAQCALDAAMNMWVCPEAYAFTTFQLLVDATINDPPSVRITDHARAGGVNGPLAGHAGTSPQYDYNANLPVPALHAPNMTLNFTDRAGTPDWVQLEWGYAASGQRNATMRLAITNRGPVGLTVQSLDASAQRYELNPTNDSVGGHSYDCLNNVLTMAVDRGVRVTLTDDAAVPSGKVCIAFAGHDCSTRAQCHGKERGRCIAPQECACRWGWWGLECEQFHCAHKKWCHGNGMCIGPNLCQCYPDFQGDTCREKQADAFFEWLLTFGDVHIQTFDGVAYTFNSVGEFHLVYSTAINLQGRLVRCTNTSQASCLKALAFRTGTDTIVLRASSNTSNTELEVFVNGVRTSFMRQPRADLLPANSTYAAPTAAQLANFTAAIQDQVDPSGNLTSANISTSVAEPPEMIQLAGAAAIVRQNNQLLVRLSSAFRFQARADGLGFVVLSFAVSEAFRNASARGLYGTYDLNAANDFTLRSGAVLGAPNDTAKHAVFGESWRVSPSESLFFYEAPDTYASINDVTFAAATTAEFASSSLRSAAESACTALGLTSTLYDACLFDVAATGAVEFAMAAASASTVSACSADPSSALCTSSASCAALNYCNLHGACSSSGACACYFGYQGAACAEFNANVYALTALAGAALLAALIAVGVVVARRRRMARKTRVIHVHPFSDVEPAQFAFDDINVTLPMRDIGVIDDLAGTRASMALAASAYRVALELPTASPTMSDISNASSAPSSARSRDPDYHRAKPSAVDPIQAAASLAALMAQVAAAAERDAGALARAHAAADASDSAPLPPSAESSALSSPRRSATERAPSKRLDDEALPAEVLESVARPGCVVDQQQQQQQQPHQRLLAVDVPPARGDGSSEGTPLASRSFASVSSEVRLLGRQRAASIGTPSPSPSTERLFTYTFTPPPPSSSEGDAASPSRR